MDTLAIRIFQENINVIVEIVFEIFNILMSFSNNFEIRVIFVADYLL